MGEAGGHRISLTIGTAGHVDHGKTTLVRYMTGTDTDRLEEEHRRGISIVPGYAELDLPSGRRASLVDVPGHERFVKNMVSGATGVDAFLLVVAADDGVMPQTSEHLDVLHTPTGLRPRVRGVQNHGHRAEVAYAGARTAIDLTGVEASEIEAGDVLLSYPVPTSRALDARVRLLENARSLAHGVRVRLHHGTRSTNARVRLTDREELEPGASTLARLRLDEPFVTLRGDRFVLRSMDGVTIGGGTVLDPSATGRRPDPSWLEALEGGDAATAVPLALARRPTEGMTTEDLTLALGFSTDEVFRAVETSAGVE